GSTSMPPRCARPWLEWAAAALRPSANGWPPRSPPCAEGRLFPPIVVRARLWAAALRDARTKEGPTPLGRPFLPLRIAAPPRSGFPALALLGDHVRHEHPDAVRIRVRNGGAAEVAVPSETDATTVTGNAVGPPDVAAAQVGGREGLGQVVRRPGPALQEGHHG